MKLLEAIILNSYYSVGSSLVFLKVALKLLTSDAIDNSNTQLGQHCFS